MKTIAIKNQQNQYLTKNNQHHSQPVKSQAEPCGKLNLSPKNKTDIGLNKLPLNLNSKYFKKLIKIHTAGLTPLCK